MQRAIATAVILAAILILAPRGHAGTVYNPDGSAYCGRNLMHDKDGQVFGVYDSDGLIGGPSWHQGTAGWYKGRK